MRHALALGSRPRGLTAPLAAAALLFLAILNARPVAAQPQVVVLDTGLSPTERAFFYHLPLGSQILPISWLRSLEDPETGARVLDGIERYGLLADPGHPTGLPVGLTVEASRDPRFKDAMFGFTCALCHVHELEYQGKRVRIDGAPSLIHMEGLMAALGRGLKAAVDGPRALHAFSRRASGNRLWAREIQAQAARLPELAAREPQLAELVTWADATPSLAVALLDAYAQTGGEALAALPEESPPGVPGLMQRLRSGVSAAGTKIGQWRSAAHLIRERIGFLKRMGQIGELPVTDPGPGRNDDWTLARNIVFERENWMAAHGPVSFPDLWGYNTAQWLTWNGATTSGMERGVATVIGLLAFFDPETHDSSISISGLVAADELAKRIRPPAWPEEVFGTIDQAKAERGRGIYAERCAGCHDAPRSVPVAELGTDPYHMESYEKPLADGRPFWEAFAKDMAAYKHKAYAAEGIGPEQAAEIEAMAPDVWRSNPAYVSRPLAGVWATAPYLHNGSVPTLDDLLKPAAERPKRFALGHRGFDPVRLGLAAEAPEGAWTFDVAEPGNSNGGHEYGAGLDADARAALIEYIKTL